MFNNANVSYCHSNDNPRIRLCDPKSSKMAVLHSPEIGNQWKAFYSDIPTDRFQRLLKNIRPKSEYYNQDGRDQFADPLFVNNSTIGYHADSVRDLDAVVPTTELSDGISSSAQKLRKQKISIIHLKSLLTKEVMNYLPSDIQQSLIRLMPICDQLVNTDLSNEPYLSSSAMNNEFFNKALKNFLRKLSNGKSVLTVDSFIKRLRKQSRKFLLENFSNKPDKIEFKKSDYSFDVPNNGKSNLKSLVMSNVVESSKAVNSFDEFSSRFYETSQMIYADVPHCISEIPKSSSFDNSSKMNDGCSGPRETAYQNAKNYSSLHVNSETDTLMSKAFKYKRKKLLNSKSPIPSKRPIRSTAGQLPARLKSLSPPNRIPSLSSDLLSLSPQPEKPSHNRTKSKEKPGKASEVVSKTTPEKSFVRQSSINSDTILLNLRNKLSKRLQKNIQSTISNHHFTPTENIFNISPHINYYNSKSPNSLSPSSDKLSFVTSPLSKNGNANFSQKASNSPHWSYSSEFTSQSSVESVLSQKNTRFDQDEFSGLENIADDFDAEEMPPPRRTLTVAAMREKLRAKKMAKEEKRKEDFDKDCPFSLMGSVVGGQHCDGSGNFKISDSENLSSFDNSSRDDDLTEESVANEFDSFLIDDDNNIDDYQVEIDDKILNYSDDLDDLLLSGTNDTLLDIIMKDPDAIEMPNENFSSLNSRSQTTLSSFPLASSSVPFSAKVMQHVSSSESSTLTTTVSQNVPLTCSKTDINNSLLLSQALTSVIEKVSGSNSANNSNIKAQLPNAYLVDGNGLSDALRLIQSLNPGAKVTTQQFYLVNSGPQLILCQNPPTQSSPSQPVNSQCPISSAASLTVAQTPSSFSRGVISNASQTTSGGSGMILSSPSGYIAVSDAKPVSQPSSRSSTVSVMQPQAIVSSNKPTVACSVNSASNVGKVVAPLSSINCKLNSNCLQFQNLISSAAASNSIQKSVVYASNSKPLTSNANNPGALGIRFQLAAQNFHGAPQQVNILHPTTALVNPPQVQLISPHPNGNISLIAQPQQPVSKLVLLYPNLSCQPKNESQHLILVSPPPPPPPAQKEQPFQTFQVLNGPNIWQQISPGFNNNLLLMNTAQQPFSFNYQQPQIIATAAGGGSLLMSATAAATKPAPSAKQPFSLSVNVGKCDLDEANKPSYHHHQASSTPGSCLEILSNSSSSANSKLSFEDRSSSDQEKSVSSPQFPLFCSDLSASLIANDDAASYSSQQAQVTGPIKCEHLSSSDTGADNCLSANANSNEDSSKFHSPMPDYDQSSDFEIPCVYSSKVVVMGNNNHHSNHSNGNNGNTDICD